MIFHPTGRKLEQFQIKVAGVACPGIDWWQPERKWTKLVNDLIDTTEMYLKAIVELEEQGVVPLRARIAERLDHSGPTVSQTVARMERDGLLVVGSDRHLILTPEGRDLATSVMRKHRLAERLLADVIGLDWELVHDEACRWEHVMSDQVEEKLVGLEWEHVHEEACRWEHVMSERVERKILAILPDHRESPYGTPIPGLEELLSEEEEEIDYLEGLFSLTEVVDKELRGDFRVRRIGEPAQVDHDALTLLTQARLRPGEVVRVSADEDRVSVVRSGSDASDAVSLPADVADHVFVESIAP